MDPCTKKSAAFWIRIALMVLTGLMFIACGGKKQAALSAPQLTNAEKNAYKDGQWHTLATEIFVNDGWENDPVRIALILEAGIHHYHNLRYTSNAYGDILRAELDFLRDSLQINRPHQDFVAGIVAYLDNDFTRADRFFRKVRKSNPKDEAIMAGRAGFFLSATQTGRTLWELFKPNVITADLDNLKKNSAGNSGLDPNQLVVESISNGVEKWNDLFNYAFIPLSNDSTPAYIGKTFDVLMFPLVGNRLLERLINIEIPDSLPPNIKTRIDLERGVIQYFLTGNTADLGSALKTMTQGQIPRTIETMVYEAEGYWAANTGAVPSDLLARITAVNTLKESSAQPEINMNEVTATLKSSDHSESYRAALYTQFWIYLWKNDRTSCRLMWRSMQYSYTVQYPDFFIPILSFMARFDDNSAQLGMQYLKTLSPKFPELRVLIPGYEMILHSPSSLMPEPVKT